MTWERVDLRKRVDDRDVRALVTASHGRISSAVRALEHYRSGEWTLLGYELRGLAVACIGFEVTPSEVLIRTLAVDAMHRDRGLARNLIGEIAAQFPGSRLVAETDLDAVDFYRRCGFEIESLGERYPGVERFRCTRVAAKAGAG